MKIINPIAFVDKERSMRPAGAKEYVMKREWFEKWIGFA